MIRRDTILSNSTEKRGKGWREEVRATYRRDNNRDRKSGGSR